MKRCIVLLAAVVVLAGVGWANAAITNIYWTDSGTLGPGGGGQKIQRAGPDGSHVEDLVTTGLMTPYGIALDVSGGKMYWTDWFTPPITGGDRDEPGVIKRADLDGSNVEDLVITDLYGTPTAIQLDLTAGKMYWTDWGGGTIRRANLDGSTVEDLVTVTEGFGTWPYGFDLDVAGGKMYWTEHGSDKIRRANLDGSDIEDILTGVTDSSTIAVDGAGGKMYFGNWVSGGHKIQGADLDGSNVEDLVTGITGSVCDIALDTAGGQVYWTEFDDQRIRRANLDGSDIEEVVTGLIHPRGIALDVSGGPGPDPNVIPEPATFIIWSLLGALTIAAGWWRRRRAA